MESLTLVVTVQCLGCGSVYEKPEGRGTMKTNPGCPTCGYLGWAFADSGVTEAVLRRRFGGDPRPRRSS